ncbi:MAG: hypothetical protein JXA11_15580 [Phycisphaerae bacterium]|nr:hypothetical protein [Phycisphaerae bacterium]
MDRAEQQPGPHSAGVATLDNSGYTFSRLGLVPPKEPAASRPSHSVPVSASVAHSIHPTPVPPPSHPTPSLPGASSAWRETADQPHEHPAHEASQPAHTHSHSHTPSAEEEYVRVTVKVPRALRDILRSCAKNTHQYQYVLVIEALAEYMVHLPDDVQRQLLRDVNGEKTPKKCCAEVPTSTWKRLWKRWFARRIEKTA